MEMEGALFLNFAITGKTLKACLFAGIRWSCSLSLDPKAIAMHFSGGLYAITVEVEGQKFHVLHGWLTDNEG